MFLLFSDNQNEQQSSDFPLWFAIFERLPRFSFLATVARCAPHLSEVAGTSIFVIPLSKLVHIPIFSKVLWQLPSFIVLSNGLSNALTPLLEVGGIIIFVFSVPNLNISRNIYSVIATPTPNPSIGVPPL